MGHLGRAEERLWDCDQDREHVHDECCDPDEYEDCHRCEQQAANEVRADHDRATWPAVREDGEPGRGSGRDGKPNEGDDSDGTDAVGLVRVHGDGDRRGAARKIRRGPRELEPPQIGIAGDTMSDEKTKKRSESDGQDDEVVAHLYVGGDAGEDDPEKKKKRATERPEDDDFGKKKK